MRILLYWLKNKIKTNRMCWVCIQFCLKDKMTQNFWPKNIRFRCRFLFLLMNQCVPQTWSLSNGNKLERTLHVQERDAWFGFYFVSYLLGTTENNSKWYQNKKWKTIYWTKSQPLHSHIWNYLHESLQSRYPFETTAGVSHSTKLAKDIHLTFTNSVAYNKLKG